MTKRGNLPWHEYVYDEYYNCVICPQYEVLSYSTTNRDGYREYKSKSYVCNICEKRSKCTESKNFQKLVTKHVWAQYLERAEDVRHSSLGKKTYSLRSQTIERVFADAKEKYGMRYTYHKGLAQVSKWVRLKFAAMNLKNWHFGVVKNYLFLLTYLLNIQTTPFLRLKMGLFDSLRTDLGLSFLLYSFSNNTNLFILMHDMVYNAYYFATLFVDTWNSLANSTGKFIVDCTNNPC